MTKVVLYYMVTAPLTLSLSAEPSSWADELPLTRDLPISEFQNRAEEGMPYDFNAPPKGMFRSIVTAEGFEEELGLRRTHEIVPVNPTEHFRTDTPAVFIIFSLHQHYQGFKVFGRCTPEDAPGFSSEVVVSEDVMHVALEDESGYLKLSRPPGGWSPGPYKVEIHAGEQVNEMSLMGTMRFTVSASEK